MTKCDKCGQEIYRRYWDIDGKTLCNVCAKDKYLKQVKGDATDDEEN